MKRFVVAAILLVSPSVFARQSGHGDDVNTARISASAFTDTGARRSTGGLGFDLVQGFSNRGVLTSSFSLVGDQGGLHAGRSFARWNGVASEQGSASSTAGSFFFQPQMFENRAGNIYLPGVLMRGIDSQWRRGKTSVNAFAGRFLVEDGSRILYVRGASDRIAGVTTTFNPAGRVSYAIQLARTTADASGTDIIRAESAPLSSLQLRQAVQLKPFRWLRVNGEYGVARAAGRLTPSYDASLEHEGDRLTFRAAYVRRSSDYLPFGLLSFLGDRRGPHAELRYRVTRWIEVGGSSVKLRTSSAESSQYNGNTSLTLPANFQLSFARSESRVKLQNNAVFSGHSMRLDSVTLTNSFRRWLTRARIDDIQLNSATRSRTRGLEIGETRMFQNGLSLSGEIRFQKSDEPDHHGTRISTAIRGGYNWGNRISLNVQTDLGRDIRNETLFALSNLRTSTASLTVKLSPSADLRFEYYGTRVNYELNRQSILASALLGNSVEPVLGGANRNVFFVQYQKTLRWGRSASSAYDRTTTGVSIVRPVGTVGGRVFVDENENGVWDEGERGAPNAIISLNQLRKTTTDESGRFEFSGVPVGPNEIALETDTLNAIFTPTVLRHPVAVAFKARVQKDFPLLAASSISGRVTEKKGDETIPVADAAIRLEPSGLYGYSDSSGEFSISNVPRGTYKLTIVPETLDYPFRVVSGPGTAIDIAHAAQLKDVEFVLERMEIAPVIERLPASKITVGPAATNLQH
jgi:hypothetical protein